MKRLLAAAIAAIALAMPAFAQERFTANVVGQGPDVILIPGLGASAATWDATVEQLKPTHRLHILNVRGFAGVPAGPNAEGPVLQPLVDEIAAYTEKLDKPAMIGHSVGGLISLEVAAAKPDAVSRVMVVDALPFYALLFNANATVNMSTPYAEQNRRQLLAMPDQQFAAMQTRTMNTMTKTETARPTLIDWTLRSDRRVVAQTMYEVTVDDARPRLPAIKAPVTVLYAVNSEMPMTFEAIGQLYTTAYRGLMHGAVKPIRDSYHFITLDQPDVFAQEVAIFLK